MRKQSQEVCCWITNFISLWQRVIPNRPWLKVVKSEQRNRLVFKMLFLVSQKHSCYTERVSNTSTNFSRWQTS